MHQVEPPTDDMEVRKSQIGRRLRGFISAMAWFVTLALAGLVIFAFTHIVFVAFGAVVLGVLYFGHRHGFDFSPNANPGGPRTPSN